MVDETDEAGPLPPPPRPQRVPDPRRYARLADWVMALTEPERGLQRRLADAAGVSPQGITKWRNGSIPEPEQLRRVADWTGVPYAVLRLLADGVPQDPEHLDSTGSFPALTSSGDVPLISWTTAGSWAEVVDPYAPGVAEDWLPCPDRHSSRTFALEVSGVSMENPGGEESYHQGDTIYVDPALQPEHGDLVVARLDDSGKATFKQLVIEGDRRLLKALNPDWKPRLIELSEAASIVGVCIGKYVRSRRRRR